MLLLLSNVGGLNDVGCTFCLQTKNFEYEFISILNSRWNGKTTLSCFNPPDGDHASETIFHLVKFKSVEQGCCYFDVAANCWKSSSGSHSTSAITIIRRCCLYSLEEGAYFYSKRIKWMKIFKWKLFFCVTRNVSIYFCRQK